MQNSNYDIEQVGPKEKFVGDSPLEITTKKILWITFGIAIIYLVFTLITEYIIPISKGTGFYLWVNINQTIIDISDSLPLFVLIAAISAEVQERKMLTALKLQKLYDRALNRGIEIGIEQGIVEGRNQVLTELEQEEEKKSDSNSDKDTKTPK
jgi:uncharacterized membrane protein YhdT